MSSLKLAYDITNTMCILVLKRKNATGVLTNPLSRCPAWTTVIRQAHVHIVAEKCDCRRIRRLSPLSRRFLRQSHFSATVWTGLQETATFSLSIKRTYNIIIVIVIFYVIWDHIRLSEYLKITSEILNINQQNQRIRG